MVPTFPSLLAGLLLAAPTPLLSAQGPEAPPPDSAALVREAGQLQAAFEEFRVDRIPPTPQTEASRCDVRIGRLCHWYGGARELDFPPEAPEVGRGRLELLSRLLEIRDAAADPWVLGQIVHYLVEDGRLAQARRVAAECGLGHDWWCHALEGYVLHLTGDFPGAEAAFREAVDRLPDEEREAWTTPRFLLSPDGERAFRRASQEERERTWTRLWRFSDPLFLTEGNDRLTDHYARLVLARIRSRAANPFLLPWDRDLEEALIRYGREIGWSRTRSATAAFRPGLQDSRQVVSHHDPWSRGYLFPDEFLTAPAEIPPETWITAPREAHTWYAVPYAPDFRGLETQMARFRRGDSLLVVGAYRPEPARLVAARPGPGREAFSDWDPFGAAPRRGDPDPELPAPGPAEAASSGTVQAGLFLVEEDGHAVFRTLGDEREGVLTLLAPTGRYVSSLELLDRDAGSAWRARQGVTQVTLPRGLAGISDLVLLREDAPIPTSLEEAVPLIRPGIRVQAEERFVLAWEVYGLQVEEPARITIGFTRGRPGFLRGVGEFLGVVEQAEPIEVTFDETGPDRIQVLFRAIQMQLPPLAPGEYTLHVRLDLAGREPAVASRPILVEP
jgi:hypothetical protein